MKQINKLLMLSLLLLFCKGSIYSQNDYQPSTIQTPNNTTVNVGILKIGGELTPQQKEDEWGAVETHCAYSVEFLGEATKTYNSRSKGKAL